MSEAQDWWWWQTVLREDTEAEGLGVAFERSFPHLAVRGPVYWRCAEDWDCRVEGLVAERKDHLRVKLPSKGAKKAHMDTYYYGRVFGSPLRLKSRHSLADFNHFSPFSQLGVLANVKRATVCWHLFNCM